MSFELTEQIERHLRGDQIAWLTTVTPSGWPAPHAVWFIWDGQAIIVYSVNGGAKVRHIEAHDQVTVHFDSGPGAGDIVVISGRASRVQDPPPPSEFPGFLDKYRSRIDAMGQTTAWYDRDFSTALRIVPERARTIP